MSETVYVSQGRLLSSSNYFIDTIPGDPDTWTAVTVPTGFSCRDITLVARSNNDVVFNHNDDPTEFHFAKTNDPGIDWVHVTYAMSIPIIKDTEEVVGYVRSDTGTYVVIIGCE